MSNLALFSVLNQVEVGSSKFARADYMNAGYPGAFNKKNPAEICLTGAGGTTYPVRSQIQIVTLIINLQEITIK